jgi:beta-glucosidase
MTLGASVPQLYVAYPEDLAEPPRQLRGFYKIELKPGEVQTVKFPLMRRDLSCWNVTEQNWYISGGKYELHAGLSSGDIQETLFFQLVNG